VADIVSKQTRSQMMAAVRQQNTAPELKLRKELHQAGLRYILHRRDLPGSPDIVFTRPRVALFVHGCFWHRHKGCSRATTPVTRAEFWLDKFAKNIARDFKAVSSLKQAGWYVIVVWECELKTLDATQDVANRVASLVRRKTQALTKKMVF
jgi:DNA mismatch endonuclease, patch repair protein